MKNDVPLFAKSMVRCAWFLLWGLLSFVPSLAQEFNVRSFRVLPNDITAYLNPVRDLNGDACALVRVVGGSDFAFSSPLGIVKRVDEVGEVLLYLPHGTIMLTLKHPQWGVLRDYRFASSLESRMTYELTIVPPPRPLEVAAVSVVSKPKVQFRRSPSLSSQKLAYPLVRMRRPPERLHYLALLQTGFHAASPSVGIRMGVMRRHGAYLYAMSNLKQPISTSGTCLRDGTLPGSADVPYYTGKTHESRWGITVGGLHRLVGELCFYEGVGYGGRMVAWELFEGGYLKNTGYSASGVSAEAGGIWRFKQWAVSAGAFTVRGKYWEATVGVGVHF